MDSSVRMHALPVVPKQETGVAGYSWGEAFLDTAVAARWDDRQRLTYCVAAVGAVLHRYGLRGEAVFAVSDGAQAAREVRLRAGSASWAELAESARFEAGGGDTNVALRVSAQAPGRQPAQVPAEGIELSVIWETPTAAVRCSGPSSLVDQAECTRMAEHLRSAIVAAALDPMADPASGVELTADERKLVAGLAQPRHQYPAAGSLTSRFSEAAARHPDRVALSCDGSQMTYAELAQRARIMAAALIGEGVVAGARVGLLAERGPELIVGLLGILMAGAAYVPIDPDYPQARQASIAKDAGLAALLLGEGVAAADPGLPAVRIAQASQVLDEPQLPEPKPDDTAYVIYTSGSTGNPKGVEVTHHNVLRLFAATDTDVGPGPGDVWTMFHSYAFDFSVWEIWGALLHGGRLVIVPRGVSRDPSAFLKLLHDEEVTVLNQTPSAFLQLLKLTGPADLPALRVVILGGEAVDASRMREWLHSGHRARLVNMYGITETTVHVTWRVLAASDVDAADSPIGTPLADLGVRLRDELGRVPPLNVPGEILVCGAGLARGYLNSEDLTRRKFRDEEGVRWYHSGDLAVLRPSGELSYLGRADRQVKVRGFRIELGDIESALRTHPSVAAALAFAAPGPSGRNSLAAFVSASNPGLTSGELLSHMRRKVPEHMVPAQLLVVADFPLTPNGKADTKALLEMLQSSQSRPAEVPPRAGSEEVLAGIWLQVLGVPPSRDDTFRDLGGDSLSIVEMIGLAREAGLELDLRAVFANRTLAQLVEPTAATTEGGTSTADIWAGMAQAGGGALNRCVTTHVGDTEAAPCYFVHWGTGNVSFLRRLPADSSRPRRIVGLEAIGLHDGFQPLTDFGRITARIADTVIASGDRQVHLGGFCFGGAVAVNAAALLQQAGVEVSSLILVDISPPQQGDPASAWSLDEFLRFRLSMVAQRYGSDPEAALRQMAYLGVADPDEPSERFLALQALWAANSYAATRWQPVAFAGPVLLACSEAHAEDVTPQTWAQWLAPQNVSWLFCPDAPDSHNLLASTTFAEGLASHLRSYT